MNYRRWLVGLAAMAVVAGCRSAVVPPAGETTQPTSQIEDVTPQPGTLTLTATTLAHSDLSTLGSALVASGIAPELEGEGVFTLLAPTDAAFEALPEGTLDALFADPAALAELIRYHIVSGAATAAELAQLGTALTLQGESITTTLSSDVALVVNQANVVEADIAASNGVLHKIDQVLLPSTVAAIAQAAPTATAPASSPLTTTEAVLLPTPTPTPAAGGVVTATGTVTTAGAVSATATLTAADALTTGEVISPAAALTSLVTISTSVMQDMTIADVVAARTDLSSTATAVATAGLAEALAEPGPFTFFAPSNAAFERVPAAELDALLNDNVRLARTMQYHVVADRVTGQDLARLGAALSTLGQSIDISIAENGSLLANGAPVLESVETSNGILHVIDGILIPADQ